MNQIVKRQKYNVANTLIGVPNIPSVVKNIKFTILLKSLSSMCHKIQGNNDQKMHILKRLHAIIVIGNPTARLDASNINNTAVRPTIKSILSNLP